MYTEMNGGVFVYVCVYVCGYVCMYVCMCRYVCTVCMYCMYVCNIHDDCLTSMFDMAALLSGLLSRRHCRVHTFQTRSDPSLEDDTRVLLS